MTKPTIDGISDELKEKIEKEDSIELRLFFITLINFRAKDEDWVYGRPPVRFFANFFGNLCYMFLIMAVVHGSYLTARWMMN